MDANSDRPDDEALDPARMLELIEDQQRSVNEQFGAFAWVISGTWGLAWLIGFGALWLALGSQSGLEEGTAFVILGAVIGAAVLISFGFGLRANRGVRVARTEAFTGAVYGSTWMVAMIGISVFGSMLISQGLPEELRHYYFTSGYVLMTGVLMMVAGAIWQAVPQVAIGVWLVGVAVIAPLFGLPGHYLFLALAGGVVFLALGVAGYVRSAATRRRLGGGDDG